MHGGIASVHEALHEVEGRVGDFPPPAFDGEPGPISGLASEEALTFCLRC